MNSRAFIALSLSTAFLSVANNHVNGFQSSLSPLNTRIRGGGLGMGWVTRKIRPSVAAKSSSTDSAAVADASIESTTDGFSWESFEDKFTSDEVPTPLLTLYRDTNGWCPFCERVWVCMRAKDLPYQERLIQLFNKPEWYKEMVPTTQVPAVLFHEWGGDSSQNSRKLVWESSDIMLALDEAFPDTIQLVHDTPEYKSAEEEIEELSKAGFAFLATARQTSSEDGEDSKVDPEEERKQKLADFLSALDKLDQSLEATGGPFRLGSEFSGIDALMVPMLERWRYQLPLKSDSPIDILEGRPFIKKWFEGMEAFAPYSERVMGDHYSWVATNVMFVKYFGGKDDEIARSGAAALELINSFKPQGDMKCERRFALEAAKKIVGNHEGIVKDCTSQDPKSQLFIPRSKEEDNANAVLHFVVQLLLDGDDAIANATSKPLPDVLQNMDDEQKEDAALAAKTVASRLCVPRDMSAPAAKILRAVLMIVSSRLSD